jgi:phosphoserine phosphatase
VEVEVDSTGKLTDKVVKPIPYRIGKRQRLEKLLPTQPLIVAGNSMGDLEMMEFASRLPLAIVFKPHLPEVKDSELALLQEATKRHWPIQIFQR